MPSSQNNLVRFLMLLQVDINNPFLYHSYLFNNINVFISFINKVLKYKYKNLMILLTTLRIYKSINTDKLTNKNTISTYIYMRRIYTSINLQARIFDEFNSIYIILLTSFYIYIYIVVS